MGYAVIAVGTDIIEIERVRKAALDKGEGFIARIYTPLEIDYCMGKKNPWPSLAARFAGKEAIFKAIGTGVTNWQEVEIQGGGNKPVKVVLSGNAKSRADFLSINKVLLSISHDRERALAFAVAVTR